MTTLSPLSLFISTYNTFHPTQINSTPKYNLLSKSLLPLKFHPLRCTKIGAFHQNLLKTTEKGVLWGEKNKFRGQKRVILVKGYNFNGGDGRRGDGLTARVLGNLVLAIGLTYLTMTGQLGWVLDTIVSLWLLAIILPVIGIGVFLWWAGRDMIQGACPNCGNPFQVFKSTLNDELQLCPYCSQPFSVEGNEFVKEPIQFSSKRSPFQQPFGDFSTWSRKENDASTSIVDVEAEVKDAD